MHHQGSPNISCSSVGFYLWWLPPFITSVLYQRNSSELYQKETVVDIKKLENAEPAVKLWFCLQGFVLIRTNLVLWFSLCTYTTRLCGKKFLLFWGSTLSSDTNDFIFTQKIHKTTEKQFMKWNVFKLHFDIWYFFIKRFQLIRRVKNNNQEKFTISYFSHMGNFSVLFRKVGWITKGAATYMMLCKVFVSIVLTIVNLAPLCIPTCFHVVASFLL